MPILLDLQSLSFPAANVAFFQREAPLVLEIGFGDGGFLASVAQAHPEWNFIGADLAHGSAARAFKRVRRAGLSNVRLYHGSGLFLLRNMFRDRSLFRVYVNFPDPWYKKRHASRRLLQDSFFELLSARLESDGKLFLTTDSEPYFRQALTVAHRSGYYRITETAPPSATLRTKYATKWSAAGRSFYHASFQKHTGHPSPFPPQIRKERGMHHALLNGSIPTVTDFDKVVHHFEDGHVIVLDVMRMIGQEGLVFIARTHEPELMQELFIQLRPARQAQADLLLSIMNLGKPLATRGSSEAVRAVSHWLTQRGLTLCGTYY
jgi:tRNA (guanine-N7-)-methyltransferase